MIEAIVFSGYTVVGAATALVIGRKIVRHDRDTSGDGLVLAAMAGLFAGFLWPVAIIGMLFMNFLRSDFERNDPGLRKQRLDERERRIRQLELELGIGN